MKTKPGEITPTTLDWERKFDEWFSQFTRPYEEYEKNKEKLREMLGLVGEKEAPMEIIARLEEIKKLRKMQYLLGHFIAQLLEEQRAEGAAEERSRINKLMIQFEKTNSERKDKIAGWYWLRSKLREALTTKEHHAS